MKDESPCGGVRKERSGEEENELRRTSRTVCPGWPPPLFFGFFFFLVGWVASIHNAKRQWSQVAAGSQQRRRHHQHRRRIGKRLQSMGVPAQIGSRHGC